ncbi:MAG: hypothetical protein K0R85_2736 [Devosia sp.]|jgi:Zn-finger nucleic acid-binding protein|nr:hypothetical protein [Devosia sp.]
MKCPIDNTELVMSERQGIEIDYCPQCRGVWLDRGELDKIIERATPPQPVMPTPQQPYDAPRGQQQRYGDNDRPQQQRFSDDDRGYRPKKKRDSFLGDIFDF